MKMNLNAVQLLLEVFGFLAVVGFELRASCLQSTSLAVNTILIYISFMAKDDEHFYVFIGHLCFFI
jgi:hypothetical protein